MLQENLKNVQAKIDAALARRSEEKITGSAVTLVAVTKNHPAEVITEALSLGLTTIGENRVQEAKAKREMLGAVGRWHLIGHLQTNKAKQAVAIFDMIESADSLHLMQKLDDEAAKAGKVQEVLLQVNIAREEQKTGFSSEDYAAIVPQLDSFKNLHVRGLMVIAPAADNPDDIRWVFAGGYKLFCELKQQRPDIDTLSMGMTHDYEVAIEEGANMVRIGTALFGQRDYSLKF